MSTITTLNTTDSGSTSRGVINTNFTNLNADKVETSVLDTDGTLAANSDSKVATQKAVKTYVDTTLGDVSCFVYQNSAGSTGSSSFTVQNFQVELYDTSSMHDTVTNSSRITFPSSGKYAFGGAIYQNGQRATTLLVKLNGSTNIIQNDGGSLMNPTSCSISGVYSFSQGDYIELYGASNGAGTTSGDSKTNFWAYKIN